MEGCPSTDSGARRGWDTPALKHSPFSLIVSERSGCRRRCGLITVTKTHTVSFLFSACFFQSYKTERRILPAHHLLKVRVQGRLPLPPGAHAGKCRLAAQLGAWGAWEGVRGGAACGAPRGAGAPGPSSEAVGT